jgi:hypothetical protein
MEGIDRIEINKGGLPALLPGKFGDHRNIHIDSLIGSQTQYQVDDPQEWSQATHNGNESEDPGSDNFCDSQNQGGDCVILNEGLVLLVFQEQGDQRNDRSEKKAQQDP